MSGCSLCGRIRAHLPAAIRARLAALEQRMGRPSPVTVETPQREDDEGDEDEEATPAAGRPPLSYRRGPP